MRGPLLHDLHHPSRPALHHVRIRHLHHRPQGQRGRSVLKHGSVREESLQSTVTVSSVRFLGDPTGKDSKFGLRLTDPAKPRSPSLPPARTDVSPKDRIFVVTCEMSADHGLTPSNRRKTCVCETPGGSVCPWTGCERAGATDPVSAAWKTWLGERHFLKSETEASIERKDSLLGVDVPRQNSATQACRRE